MSEWRGRVVDKSLYYASCSLCGYTGPERRDTLNAMVDLDQHHKSEAHRNREGSAIIARAPKGDSAT